jgi:hypothetical protein
LEKNTIKKNKGCVLKMDLTTLITVEKIVMVDVLTLMEEK